MPAALVARATRLLLFVLCSSSLEAQQLEPRPTPTRAVESFTFQSPSMGVRFAVTVGLPNGYKPGGTRKYPALVTTDGDWLFAPVHEGVRSLDGVIDPMFVVSIGTALNEGDSLWTRRRIHEFSPMWDLKDPFGELVSATCKMFGSAPGRCVGGAPQFLNTIVTELVPLVAARYAIDTAQLGLFGLSAGGFFASWSMFQEISPFRKYLISSPAMSYGNGEIFRQEARYAASHKDMPIAVYLGAGVLETSDGMLEGIGQIVSGMSRLSGLLAGRKYPNLRVTTEFHPGLGHTDVVGTTVARGLRVLYAK